MHIGLIDVDGHNYPNLPLMKISAYHKSTGSTCEWWSKDGQYDVVYMSKVFSGTYSPDIPAPDNARHVVRGGTGYAIDTIGGREIYDRSADKALPQHVEHIYPDYSLYPKYTGYGQPLTRQTAYGFLTRGCPRGCSFCHVANKEGRKSVQVADLEEFWHGQGNIELLDPNILACQDRDGLLARLADSRAKVNVSQGLDARLIDMHTADLLTRIRLKAPHFAMDTMEQMDAVARGLRNYKDAYYKAHGKWNWRYGMVYVLTNYDTTHAEDMERIRLIRDCGFHPYIMIYSKPSAPTITRRLARWCNNVAFYAKYDSFTDYQRNEYKREVI